MRISRDLGLGKRSIAVVIKPFDHPCGNADGDGVGRDVIIGKAEGLVTHHTAFADTIIFKRP